MCFQNRERFSDAKPGIAYHTKTLFGLWPLLTVWAVGVALCAWWQFRYESTPGPTLALVETWPAEASITRRQGRFTLVMALHPRCPCSRASMEELEDLAMRTGGAADIVVLAAVPEPTPADWKRAAACEGLANIPGVAVVLDSGGVLAHRFVMRTSGHVALYNANGRLVFSGGITPARGQVGPNKGVESIIALIDRPMETINFSEPTPVFGCELVGDEELCR